MPRDLGDVLHYLLPEAESEVEAPDRGARPAALPIVSVPIGGRDVLRAAFAWNLSVEVARQGASAVLVVPNDPSGAAVWPDAGRGPVGSEVIRADVDGLSELNRAALDVAVERAADASDGGVVLVHVPPRWLDDPAGARALLRWVLLFSSPERRDLLETYALAKRVLASHGGARVGVTIHGARHIDEAEAAYRRLAAAAARHLPRPLLSYGLLVDDLHVYRAIVARRPIGLEHPQCRAARAMRDVARLLLDDCGDDTVG